MKEYQAFVLTREGVAVTYPYLGCGKLRRDLGWVDPNSALRAEQVANQILLTIKKHEFTNHRFGSSRLGTAFRTNTLAIHEKVN